MNSDETFKGYGYVEFASAEAAEKVAFHVLLSKQLNDSYSFLCSISTMHTHTSIVYN